MTTPVGTWQRPDQARVVRAALAALGIDRLVLAIHDVSFPAGAYDLGRGSPYGDAGRAFFAFARALGFTGVQLGPQGRTSAANPSPYDAMLFSREESSLAPEAWLPAAELRALAGDVPPGAARRADHAGARARAAAALARIGACHAAALAPSVAEFARAQSAWLERDARFAACAVEAGGDDWRRWPALDPAEVAARRPRELDEYRRNQYLLGRQHIELRDYLKQLGLRLYGDLQIGISHADAWSLRPLFLRGYRLGAPPSRTNPEGQPWSYPVLDPAQYDGGAGALVELRADRMLADYDGLRVDHPHGLVDPWVYRDDRDDELAAVQSGARLFSSPDLPDHPALRQFVIPRADALGRARPRWADDWVRALDEHEVDRYAVLFTRLVARARAHGRAVGDLMCEVLSTWPLPLRRVMERAGLGRMIVTQKADVDDPRDVYRSDGARAGDWIMVGNHDTPPLWREVERWHGGAAAARRARFLAERLEPEPAARGAFAEQLARSPGALATAMFAELFVSRANNVSIFFADLLGYRDIYNIPGTVSDDNWRLRVAPDHLTQYAADIEAAEPRALDLPRALALALAADGARRQEHAGLIAALRALAGDR